MTYFIHGSDLDDCVAQNVADGNWDPITMRPFVEVARASSVEPLFARRQSAPPALTATSHCVSTSNDSIEKITPEDILLRQIQVYPATAPLSHYAQRRAIHKMTLPPANPFQLRRCRSSQQQLITAFTVATSSDFQKMKSEDGENDDDVNTAMRLSRPSDTPDNVNAYVAPTLRQESTKLRVIRTSKFFIGCHKSKAPQALSVQMGTEHVVAPDHDVTAALCDGDEASVPKTAIASTVLSHTSANISKNRLSNRTLLPSANAGVHGRLKLDRFKSQLMK